MDNKAKSNILWDNVIYLLILVLFIAMISTYIWLQMNGTGVWSQYYSKEIVKVINLASPGDEISLDVHKATEVADENRVPFEEIFTFDTTQNELCVKLSLGRKTCYSYLNEVNVTEDKIQLASPVNILTFKIQEKNV